MVFIGAMFSIVRPVAGQALRSVEGREPGSADLAYRGRNVDLALMHRSDRRPRNLRRISASARLFRTTAGLLPRSTISFEKFVLILLLPAFFAFTGMRTEIGLLSGWNGG